MFQTILIKILNESRVFSFKNNQTNFFLNSSRIFLNCTVSNFFWKKFWIFKHILKMFPKLKKNFDNFAQTNGKFRF